MMTVHLFKEILCNNKSNHNNCKYNHVENTQIIVFRGKESNNGRKLKSKLYYVKMDHFYSIQFLFYIIESQFYIIGHFILFLYILFSIFQIFKNSQIFISRNELQNGVLEKKKKGELDVVDARSIIKFCGGFNEILSGLNEIMAKEKIICILILPSR